jgi:hypothetical protein
VSEAMHDAGGQNHFALPPGVCGAARFAGDRNEHRITLTRWLDPSPDDANFALWIGMNPSTAEADVDDLTVRKEWTWTRRLGFYRYVKMNAASYRATDPKVLASVREVNHPDNLPLIVAMASAAAMIVLSTGNPTDVLLGHYRTMVRALKAAGLTLQCLGTTKDGWPKHSSRIGYDTPFVEFRT